MQAEGIRTGDRYDQLDGRGRTTGGWTATGDAVVEAGMVYIPVRYHDGLDSVITRIVGAQVDLTFGAGGDMQRTVKHPPGTPEYDTYAKQLRAELAKFAAREAPYEHDWCPDCGCNVALSCVCSKPCPRH